MRKYTLPCGRRESIMYEKKMIWTPTRLGLHIRKQSQAFALKRSKIYIYMGQYAGEKARQRHTRSSSRVGVAGDVRRLPLSPRVMRTAISMEWYQARNLPLTNCAALGI